jgi:hypothetical protein
VPLLIKGNSFWAEFCFLGKRHRIALGITVEGRVPHPLSTRGDAIFESARRRAEVAFEEAKLRCQSGEQPAPKSPKIPSTNNGATPPPALLSPSASASLPLPEIPLNQLFPLWVAAPRRRKLKSERRKKEVKALTDELIAFLARKYPAIKNVSQINFTAASGFIATFPKAMAAKTVNNRLINLRALVKASGEHTGLKVNPFKKIPLREVDTIAPKPYTEEQLGQILTIARNDEEIGGMVITAICTGLRRADCACLDWGRVNLESGLIALPTSKTGKDAVIPIMPPLRRILESLSHRSGFCFLKSAAIFKSNPDGLNLRLERLLAKAGMHVSALKLDFGQERLRKRTDGGFHRFKTTFVSLAIECGIPLEIIQKIVGNTDIEVLQRHYNKVDVKVVTKQMLEKLPETLGGQKSAKAHHLEQLRTLLTSTTAKQWPQIREEALRLINLHLDGETGK